MTEPAAGAGWLSNTSVLQPCSYINVALMRKTTKEEKRLEEPHV